MKRINATVPRWDGDKWTHRPMIDGKQRKITSRKAGKAGSQECIRKENAIRAGQDGSSIRFDKAWELHLADRKAMLGKSLAVTKAESVGRIHLIPRLKNKKVHAITEQDWQDCLTKAKPQSDKLQQLSKKTLQNIRGEITLFCKFAKRNRWIDALPEPPTVPKTAPSVGKAILHPNQLKTLLADTDGDWYVNVWRLMVVTGLRPGEAYGLQWQDVESDMISIRQSINYHRELTDGKNANARRIMFASDIARRIIDDQRKQTAHLKSDWVFCDPNGDMINPYTIRNHWDKYRAAAGFPEVTQYGLRHTFVSVSKSALPEALLKQVVGHSKAMDTLRIYGKEIDSDKVQAAKIIDGVFKKYKSSPNLVPERKQKA